MLTSTVYILYFCTQFKIPRLFTVYQYKKKSHYRPGQALRVLKG